MKPSGNLSCSCLIKLNLEFEKTGFPFFFLGESDFFFFQWGYFGWKQKEI